MNYQVFLSQLENVKHSANTKATARCPAHDDEHNSLSVCEGDDGRILIKCHAGCDLEDVVGAMGLNLGDLFQTHEAQTPKVNGYIERTYDYRDESGDLLFQVVRFANKRFCQRRPDGNGGWHWGLNGLGPVLYRLPELLKSKPGVWVYVVEGEKDVDRLRSLGLIATSNPMGAGKWRESYSEILSGRKVCIIPDNDAPGRKHAQDVAYSVSQHAKVVHIVELPDLPPKGDVSDWLDRGGTIHHLVQLTSDAPEYERPVEKHANDGEELRLSECIERDLSAWEYTFAEDEMDGRIYANGRLLDDAVDAEIMMRARDVGYGGKGRPLKAIDDTILVLARRNQFHPVRDWLDSLEWNGHDHFAMLTDHFKDRHRPIEYGDAKTMTTFGAFLYRFQLGCVARAYGDRNVQNPMLVLAGDQGIGKSYFTGWLCGPLPEMYVEQRIDPHSTDHHRLMASKWIWEVPELGSTTGRTDKEALKGVLTQTTVTFRIPYARYSLTKPVLANFIGTINNEEGFLNDATGSRRFLCVDVSAIDHAYSDNLDVTQLWAQIVAMYKSGEQHALLPCEAQRQRELNSDNYVTNDTREAILKYYDLDPGNQTDEWWTFTVDIAQRLNGEGIKTSTTSVGSELRRELGYSSQQRQLDGRRGKGFFGIRMKAF